MYKSNCFFGIGTFCIYFSFYYWKLPDNSTAGPKLVGHLLQTIRGVSLSTLYLLVSRHVCIVAKKNHLAS
jgi:hypothetical protein